jgi:signal transduction histidine kinase
MKVLIVDDLAPSRKLLRINLQAEGIETIEAADGLQALSLMEKETPDAIISDILMPQMDGYRLCQEVRKHDKFGHSPFIFYTSTYTSPSDEQLALDCGGDRYIKKPAPIGTILDSLRELSKTESPRPRTPTQPEVVLVMREYNEALVRKLEDRNLELEKAREELAHAYEGLERRVEERTADLLEANQELEAFSHSLAHDMRSPIMAVETFVEILLEDCAGKIGETSLDQIRYIGRAVNRINELTNDLLRLARASRADMLLGAVDLSAMVDALAQDLQLTHPARQVEFVIAAKVHALGDQSLLRIALENLLNNAWKFTGKTPHAKIEFGSDASSGEKVYYLRDNGAGFEMEKAGKLFGNFVRLHSADDFPGTGIGLATAQRVIRRHGGRVWAEAKPGQGATFYFVLNAEAP